MPIRNAGHKSLSSRKKYEKYTIIIYDLFYFTILILRSLPEPIKELIPIAHIRFTCEWLIPQEILSGQTVLTAINGTLRIIHMIV